MRAPTNANRWAALPLAVLAAALMLALLFLLLTPRVARAGGVVNTCNETGLRQAMAGGGSVSFNCGAPVTITFASQIVITQDTTIDGGTLGQVILSGNNITRLFTTTAGVNLTLLNLILRDADSDQSDGGALWAGGPTTIAHSAFISNATSDDAGAIYAAGAPLTVTDSLFHHNFTPDFGGAILSVGPVWVTNSEFYSNSAEGGGALALEAESHVTGSSFHSNTASASGGAIYAYNGGDVWVTASQFYSNTADYGGAINAAGLGLWLNSSSLHHNAATYDGGAVSTANPTTISGSELYSNTADYGGLAAYGAVTLTNSSLHHNTASTAGGGLDWDNAATLRRADLPGEVRLQNGVPNRAVLTDVDIYSNLVTGGYGGGANLEGEWASLVRVRIFNNRIDTGYVNYAGGGLAIFYGGVVMTDSAVYGNVAGTGPGGGIHASYGATLTLVTSAVYSNVATTSRGGGIDAESTGGLTRLRIYNSTVSGNSAVVGGGVYLDPLNTYATISDTTLYGNLAPLAAAFSGTTELHGSIIAGSGALNCGGAVKGYGYNLDDGDSCDLGAAGDITDTNPLLAPLGWNGGPTLTHAPLTGSPVIDTGNPASCPATDQRGAARPVDGDNAGGARCDMGAYEFAATIARLFLPLAMR